MEEPERFQWLLLALQSLLADHFSVIRSTAGWLPGEAEPIAQFPQSAPLLYIIYLLNYKKGVIATSTTCKDRFRMTDSELPF
jgi:hypothetical protein